MNNIKKKNLGFIILVIIVFLPKLVSLDTNSITFYPSKYNELNNDTFTELKSAQENLIWSRIWGGPEDEEESAIWGDGSFIYTCGSTESFGAGDYDLVLVKWDSNGNKLWDRTWGGPYADSGMGIWGDGSSIYTCGETSSFGAGNRDLLLVKWNIYGNLLWNFTWIGPSLDAGYGIWGDEPFLYTCGYIRSVTGYSDACLVKWDNAGNQVWNSTWGGPYGTHDFLHGCGIWGYGTFLYTWGTTGTQYGSDFILIKWESNEYLEIILNNPSENMVYESGTQIDIDIEKELVILDTVLYKWDGDGIPDTEWPEPYTTNLPPGDGTHTLYVSAETYSPYIFDSESFTFITDDTDPEIQILSPTTNEVWDSAPAYDLDINEPHIADRWYTLNDGPNHYFYSDAGEIDGTAWKALPDGDVTIKFSVSDTLGHIDFDQVVVRKDTKAEQRELNEMIRNAIIGVVISAGVGGAIGLGYFLIKRSIKKRDEKLKSEKTS